jgi:4-diphosphocytidyl-2-C-methyl-D-erythritol kinase
MAVLFTAPAKLNLCLYLGPARDDGLHELCSLFEPLTVVDRIEVSESGSDEVICEGVEGENLAERALAALRERGWDGPPLRIEIEKRIPVAAGLGGGSADAAATLMALNRLWGCDLDPATLGEVAERIGSDVPALLLGGPVLMSGRGELLAPAEVASFWWVVVHFDFGVRSPDAYRWWDEDGGVAGPDPDPLLEAAAAGDAERLGPLLFNDLEAVVARRHPAVGEAKQQLLAAGALGAVMSGSGSSVVGLARDRDHAEQLASGFPNALVASGPPAREG